MRIIGDILVVAVLIGLAVLVLVACAARDPIVRTEFVTVTKDVDRIVQVRCPDRRAMQPDYPDTDEKLSTIEVGDIFALAQAYRAGKLLREARERDNDAQIASCTGE